MTYFSNLLPRSRPNEMHLVFSHPITFKLFQHIATNGNWKRDDLIKQVSPSLKQFYNGMAKLKKEGLVKRVNGETYALTTYGKMIAKIEDMLKRTTEAYWSISALDQLKCNVEMPDKEFEQITEKIVGDKEVRALIG